jgi:acyl-coenzyme A thioesterase PaaI-like protein
VTANSRSAASSVAPQSRSTNGFEDVPDVEGQNLVLPQASAEGARCTIGNGPHLGNRVGHLQGGLQLGMAIVTAEATLPPGWMTSGISTFFIGAGVGAEITAEARVEHPGRNTAVVRTRLTAPGGQRVLDATTTHIRRT